MRPLSVTGMLEVSRLRRRVRKALAMERVLPEDAAYLIERLDEMEARMVTMYELDEFGKEAGNGQG